MLRKIQIKPEVITKVKTFDDCVAIYSKDEYWVCVQNQSLIPDENGMITILLKDKCGKYEK